MAMSSLVSGGNDGVHLTAYFDAALLEKEEEQAQALLDLAEHCATANLFTTILRDVRAHRHCGLAGPKPGTPARGWNQSGCLRGYRGAPEHSTTGGAQLCQAVAPPGPERPLPEPGAALRVPCAVAPSWGCGLTVSGLVSTRRTLGVRSALAAGKGVNSAEQLCVTGCRRRRSQLSGASGKGP
jgi:hypothetical protein